MKTILDLSSEQLRQAAQIKEQITSLEKQLQAILGGSAPAAMKEARGGANRMSAASRAKISAAAKARWAKAKANNQRTLAAAKPAQRAGNRKPMSAARKAQIASAMKARWAKIKAAK
jgi:hypothetical protein